MSHAFIHCWVLGESPVVDRNSEGFRRCKGALERLVTWLEYKPQCSVFLGVNSLAWRGRELWRRNSEWHILLCMWMFCLHVWMCATCMSSVYGLQISWNCCCRWLGAPMGVLKIKPRSSLRAASALNCCAASLAPSSLVLIMLQSQGLSSVGLMTQGLLLYENTLAVCRTRWDTKRHR